MLGTMRPDTNSHVWKELIIGHKIISFNFMAANILTRRIRDLYTSEPSEDNLQFYARQLRELFVRNAELPSVKSDIDKISDMVN